MPETEKELSMRYSAIVPDLIARNFGQFTNAFWRAFSQQLRRMLSDKAKPTTIKEIESAITEEVMYIGPELLQGKGIPHPVQDVRHRISDWAWYVPERTCPAGRLHEVGEPPEAELLRELKADPIDGIKQVILVHGQTGHGKTTFLRHFFYHWLPKTEPTLFPRHIVIRVSMGLSGFGSNIENDYDNKIHRALTAAFPWALSPTYLFEVARHQHRRNPVAIEELERDFPRNERPRAIIKWLLEFNNSYVSYAADEEYHDFNRTLVEYLTEKCGVSFIFVMDNVDQTPQTLQDRFYMLARHKLDWIRSIDKVVFILGVRSYLLDKVYKESVVQAFTDPPRVRIFPPPLHAFLAARIRSFDSELTADRYNITMDDGKTLDVPKTALTQMLHRFNQNYSDQNNDVVMARLSSFDMRRQSEFLLACLRSRAIEWCDYVNFFSQGHADVHFSQHDILRSILRDSNALVAPPPDQMLLNLFSCGTGSHFANSLNRWYILRMLSCSDRNVDKLLSMLDQLGHPDCVSRKSLNDMLLADVIASPEGVKLKDDHIESITVSDESTLLGREFLTNLPFNLIYLQCMAFLTPFDEDITKEVPEVRRRDGATFDQSMAATAMLLRQIRRDETAQLRHIQGNTEALSLAAENQLTGFADRITQSVKATLKGFRDRKIIIVDDWDSLLSRFDVEK